MHIKTVATNKFMNVMTSPTQY